MSRESDSRIFWAFGKDSPAVQLGLRLCGLTMESHELDGSFFTGAQRCQPIASLGGLTQAKVGCVRPYPEGNGESAWYFRRTPADSGMWGSSPEAGEGQRKGCSPVCVQRLRREQEWVGHT